MQNFQSIVFIWTQTYREIFKSTLVYVKARKIWIWILIQNYFSGRGWFAIILFSWSIILKNKFLISLRNSFYNFLVERNVLKLCFEMFLPDFIDKLDFARLYYIIRQKNATVVLLKNATSAWCSTGYASEVRASFKS